MKNFQVGFVLNATVFAITGLIFLGHMIVPDVIQIRKWFSYNGGDKNDPNSYTLIQNASTHLACSSEKDVLCAIYIRCDREIPDYPDASALEIMQTAINEAERDDIETRVIKLHAAD